MGQVGGGQVRRTDSVVVVASELNGSQRQEKSLVRQLKCNQITQTLFHRSIGYHNTILGFEALESHQT